MNTKSKQPLLSFPKPKFTTGMIRLSITLLFSTLCIGSFGQKKSSITVETLLEEMIHTMKWPAIPPCPTAACSRAVTIADPFLPICPAGLPMTMAKDLSALKNTTDGKKKVLFRRRRSRRHYPYMAHDLWQHTYNLAFLLWRKRRTGLGGALLWSPKVRCTRTQERINRTGR